eukprot:5032700-Prymnesium_polylepis.2
MQLVGDVVPKFHLTIMLTEHDSTSKAVQDGLIQPGAHCACFELPASDPTPWRSFVAHAIRDVAPRMSGVQQWMSQCQSTFYLFEGIHHKCPNMCAISTVPLRLASSVCQQGQLRKMTSSHRW